MPKFGSWYSKGRRPDENMKIEKAIAISLLLRQHKRYLRAPSMLALPPVDDANDSLSPSSWDSSCEATLVTP
ncbi:hypothetical protein Csa_012591 [Cucumis sativus]|uniref:Uncharacterized protein n=1 Tax=Cucumis sativus TaxID=3659 RepID=A0A0A0L0K4_CUCSA|nr:hypothetical protein Csa_012591 [Cucumis sativus]